MNNILIYLHAYPNFGGIETVTTQLANWLINRIEGIWIYSFVRNDNPELDAKLDKRINLVQAENGELINADENRAQLKNLIETNHIKRILFQDSYAPVHHLLFSVTSNMPDVKVIIAEHNTPDCFLKALKSENPKGFKAKVKHAFLPLRIFKTKKHVSKRIQWLYHRCCKYVLLSDAYKSIVIDLVPEIAENSQKLIAIANAAPMTKNNSQRGIRRKEKVCLFCQRLTGQKGLNYLVEVWRQIERQRKDWKLLVVGDGPGMGYLQQKVKELKFTNIQFEGYRTETAEYYEKSSIFLLTSRFEGWSMSLIEAMGSGCTPVLFGSYAAAYDIVHNGETGYVIPPFDTGRFSQTLIYLMDNENRCQEIGRKAKASMDRYDMETIGQQWLELLK